MTAIRQDFLLSTATNASIKVWGSAISANLSAIGLVQTADTGQINWSTTTVTASGANQVFGYEIWRFNDALQATRPIFLKIIYGTSNAAASIPSLNIQTGSATNGAGTLNTMVSTIRGGQNDTGGVGVSNPSAATWPQPHYFFGDGSSVVIALCAVKDVNAASVGSTWIWVIERARNADGTPNGNGYIYLNAISDRTSNYFFSHHNQFSFTLSTVVGTNFYWPIPCPGTNFAGSVDQNTVYTYPVLLGTPKPEAQCMAIVGFQNGLTWYQTVTLIVNGQSHTYLVLPLAIFCPPGSSQENQSGSQNWCTGMMRFD